MPDRSICPGAAHTHCRSAFRTSRSLAGEVGAIPATQETLARTVTLATQAITGLLEPLATQAPLVIPAIQAQRATQETTALVLQAARVDQPAIQETKEAQATQETMGRAARGAPLGLWVDLAVLVILDRSQAVRLGLLVRAVPRVGLGATQEPQAT